MNLHVEPPKKKKKKKTKNSHPSLSPPSSSSPSFSLLPNEIAVNCLARISRSYYPIFSIFSKSLRSTLSSTELYAARSHLGNTEQCIYVCLWDRSYQFPQWFTLWVNPNRTLPDDMIKKRKKKKKNSIGQLLFPTTSSNFPSLSKTTVVFGSEIYVIGGSVDYVPSSAVRVLDCCSHTWRDAPSMIVARKNAVACVYAGKIYVMGGCGGLGNESWAEVFDTKTQTWERLPNAGPKIRNCFISKIAEIDGKIHFGNSYHIYAYDPEQCKWERSKLKSATFVRSGCVMEDVSYRFIRIIDRYRLMWSKNRIWKEVKGLDSLGEMYMRNGGSSYNTTKLVSCGGKLFLIWEGFMRRCSNAKKKIWCAEIVIEKRDGGEVWGKAEWVDVVHTVPTSCQLLHCLVVTV